MWLGSQTGKKVDYEIRFSHFHLIVLQTNSLHASFVFKCISKNIALYFVTKHW